MMQVISKADIGSLVKNVAMYVRKSRGETDKDIENHRFIMREICETYNWNYVEYQEFVSGDSIAERAEIKKLIKDCYEGIFDAVLVYDYDRLGRGSGTDQDTIINMFKDNEMVVAVANPFQILNPFDENDEFQMETKGFLARQEYKMIKKRLQSGKKVSLRMGRWSHSFTPFGYDRDPEEKKLVPNPEESRIYREMIVERYLSGEVSTADIAWELNRKGIKTRRGNLWTSNAVLYLLKSETHLGDIVFNTKKSKKDRNTGKYTYSKLPRSEWMIVRNCHTALKTLQQHERILKMLKSKSSHSNHGKNALTGLVKCFSCGKSLTIQKNGDELLFKKCSECNNSGGSCELVEYTIKKSVVQMREQLVALDRNDEIIEERKKELINKIEELEEALEKNQGALERIEEAFEMGFYDANKARTKIEQRSSMILEIEGKILDLQHELSSTEKVDRNNQIKRLDEFIGQIDSTKQPEKKNAIYKKIIESVVWKRPAKSDDLEIIVNFL